MRIAHNTRIRCTSGKIFFYKIFNHKATKLFAYIQYKMRKAMLYSSLACVIKAVQVAATGFFMAATTGSIVPGLHCYTHYFISFMMKHKSSNGTIYTATHS